VVTVLWVVTLTEGFEFHSLQVRFLIFIDSFINLPLLNFGVSNIHRVRDHFWYPEPKAVICDVPNRVGTFLPANYT
jgi:hypothetical protein